ncbi:MAG: HDIG domain-containing metalloprotein [Candidatus Andersenbacteria bacterium]
MADELLGKTRAQAWELLNEYTKNPNLIKHALAVESAMRYYARHFGEDEEVWGMVGLLHDFDYEQYPNLEEHPYKGQAILEAANFPPVIRQGIMAHAPHTGTPRTTTMEKAIFAVDELCGFTVAVTLIRPSKKVADVDVAAVKKKLKQKKFAANVSREDISLGAQELGFSLEEHIQHVLAAMQQVSDDLGL